MREETTIRWRNAAPFQMKIQGAVAIGRCQNPTECEHIRRLPCGQLLRAAVAEELRHRRSRVAKQESGGGLAVGQHRRPGRPGIRRAPFGARTPTIKSPITQPEMPERTHATDPLGQRFRSGRAAADPIAARRRRRIGSAGRGAALACARKRPSDGGTRPPFR